MSLFSWHSLCLLFILATSSAKENESCHTAHPIYLSASQWEECSDCATAIIPETHSASSPTERFLLKHSMDEILSSPSMQGVELNEISYLQQIVANETCEFVGYHGGSTDYGLFQDLIRFLVEEVLDIPIRSDFHFLRAPLIEDLHFNTADDFLRIMKKPIDDTQPSVRQHIIALNIALYQSYDSPHEFTLRYFLKNTSWTKPDYWTILLDFAEKIGLCRAAFQKVIAYGQTCLPQTRGILMQFSVKGPLSKAFINRHFYTSQPQGCPLKQFTPVYYLETTSVYDFPQLRLVINQKDILNPSSSLVIHRYDSLTAGKRESFEKTFRKIIRSLPIKSEKQATARQALISLWNLPNNLLPVFSSYDLNSQE